MLMLILLLLKLQLLWREIYEALYLFHYFHRGITKIGKKHHTTAQVNKKKQRLQKEPLQNPYTICQIISICRLLKLEE